MRIVQGRGIVVVGALCSDVGWAARSPPVLSPITPWNLHYGEDSCELKRAFGDPKKPTVMVLGRTSPDSPLTLLVIGQDVSGTVGETDAKAAFLPFAENSFRSGMIAETVNSPQKALFWTNVNFVPHLKELKKAFFGDDKGPVRTRKPEYEAILTQREKDTAAKVSAVEITTMGRRAIVLQTGAMGKAIDMMRDCAREQLIDWGIDPAIEDKIVRPAFSPRNVASLISDLDYPVGAAAAGEQADLQARLNIDAAGTVTKCKSLTVFRAPDFADLVCGRLSKARFQPAELADGTKVPSYRIITVSFRMAR